MLRFCFLVNKGACWIDLIAGSITPAQTICFRAKHNSFTVTAVHNSLQVSIKCRAWLDVIDHINLDGYGFGEKKTPLAFVAACDKFIYTEILRAPIAKPAVIEEPQALKPLLTAAIAAAAKEDGWAPLSNVGSLVLKGNPSFDPRNYGCEKLGELVGQQTYLKVKKVPATDGSPNAHIYVRLK